MQGGIRGGGLAGCWGGSFVRERAVLRGFFSVLALEVAGVPCNAPKGQPPRIDGTPGRWTIFGKLLALAQFCAELFVLSLCFTYCS